jgi:hypothetical protein
MAKPQMRVICAPGVKGKSVQCKADVPSSDLPSSDVPRSRQF